MSPTTAEPPLITEKRGLRNLVRDGARQLPGVVASWWPCETESGNHWHSIESAHNKIRISKRGFQPAHRKSLEWFFGSMPVKPRRFQILCLCLAAISLTTAKETDPMRGYVITITRDLANSRTEPAFGDGNGISDRAPIALFNPRYNLQISDFPTRTGAIAITAR
ncbi:hypothetical protein L209DRAFT_772303 [Thermothelomyces heterothallicus CBS 203.75]